MKSQGSGRIINITSVSAQTGGVSGAVNYTASKGGLAAMTKTLARDLASPMAAYITGATLDVNGGILKR